jgi:hypothetical protein
MVRRLHELRTMKRPFVPFVIRAPKLPTLVGLPTASDTQDEAPLYLSPDDVREIETLLMIAGSRKKTTASNPAVEA